MDDEGTQWTADGRTSVVKASMVNCIFVAGSAQVESGTGVAAARTPTL